MAAEWLAHAIDAVQRWIAREDGPGRVAAWSDLGVAVPGGEGQLVVDRRGREQCAIVEACFAGAQGPEHEPAYPVDELRDDVGVLLLRPPQGLPERSRHLWVRSLSPRSLREALRDGLRVAGPAPLAQALAEGRLSGAPADHPGTEGLSGEQGEALRACLSPGVRLVWGPPGTGTTEVLARAVEELVGAGKRVLLVSTTDSAVDDVLHAALARMAPAAGTAVRVGAAARAEIAGDPGVSLERLAAPASRELDEQRAAIAAELREIEEAAEEVERLRVELGEHDEPVYRAAVARIEAERVLDGLGTRVEQAQAEADDARRATMTAATELRAALAARAEIDPVRDALEQERRAVEGLAAIAQRQDALRLQLRALEAEERSAGWRGRRQRRRAVDAADTELRRFTVAAAEGRRRWLDAQLGARAVLGERGRADVDAVDARVARAENAMAIADEEFRRARDRLAELRATVAEAQGWGPLTDDDRRLVSESEERGLPARHARLQELLGRMEGADARREELAAEHRELLERARALRSGAVARILGEAGVVATTLARSRSHPALGHATFDAVLVDGAGAVPLAEVLLVLCRATTTAVLVGDLLQLAPALPDDAGPELRRWIGATCFSHVGIGTPDEAVAHEGCVALTQQSRFGAGLRRLANEALYERLHDADAPPRTEVVLIDVATAAVPAADGLVTALPRALAALHAPDGPVGVVAPCAARAEAVLASFRDHGLVMGVTADTVHALQGREFATAVVDLRTEVPDDGQRAFGLAVATARRRLYLLADGAAVGAAEAGPLRALRDAVERGEVRTWSAAALLGTVDPPIGPVEAAFAEVSAQLRELDSGDAPRPIPEQRRSPQEPEPSGSEEPRDAARPVG
ncbi:AAA domain-containing protein [Pseudonocardia sp. MH-G8]|uniref:AAA domain-containing protein n=1 Tax=Pseudonocardia sp. MH-G8 TaxID=1854588 RepID=UPI000BA0CEDE|nr:AAA domain-containing protein [Pseudonocardia sp. MH-G8]OZM77313.1 hypothetical protein CFP66_36030 [Pseudonocardia sp. MH-G8]